MSEAVRFFLQNDAFSEWAMLVSNQRPLPCECESLVSLAFAVVRKPLEAAVFAPGASRGRSPPFAWVGVLLVYR